jgi:hypothetical protein
MIEQPKISFNSRQVSILAVVFTEILYRPELFQTFSNTPTQFLQERGLTIDEINMIQA